MKESNRAEARHIGTKLRAVNCATVPSNDLDPELLEFTPQEIDLMAQMEHDRWKQERLRDGWTYGPPPKDPVRKTNPLLVEWDKLEETVRDSNRRQVGELPALLARVGFQIYRRRVERLKEDTASTTQPTREANS